MKASIKINKSFKKLLFVFVVAVALNLGLAPNIAFAKAGAPCSETDANGQESTGTLDDKGVCNYNKGILENGSKKPGDPGINYCGDVNKNAIVTSIDFGCKHLGNAILDLAFAVIRFLTLGVGLVLIASSIVAGIQFTASKGDPQATSKALGRITSTVSALLLFIFIYAILNWLIPNVALK